MHHDYRFISEYSYYLNCTVHDTLYVIITHGTYPSNKLKDKQKYSKHRQTDPHEKRGQQTQNSQKTA